MHSFIKRLLSLSLTIIVIIEMLVSSLSVSLHAASIESDISAGKASASVRTIYVLTDELIEGESYVIVSSNSVGEDRYALSHSDTNIVTDMVTIHAASEDDYADDVFIKEEDVDPESVWTVAQIGPYTQYLKLINGDYALSPNGGTYFDELVAKKTSSVDAYNVSYVESEKYRCVRFYNGSEYRYLSFRDRQYSVAKSSSVGNYSTINIIRIYKKLDIHKHSLVYHSARPATCTESGWNAYYTCSSCDYTTFAEIPALGHDYEDAVTEATCIEQGFTTHTCSRCEDSFVDTYIEALGHDMQQIIARVPSCEENGCIMHFECERCGKLFLDEDGNTELNTEEVYDPAIGHVWSEPGTVTKEPTCTENGVLTYICLNDSSHTRTEEIPATGHEPGEIEVENHIEADCTIPESYDEVIYCTVCGEELQRATMTGEDALGHVMVLVPSKGATCEEDGNSKHYKCSRCGKLFIDAHGNTEINPENVTIPATGHEYAETVLAPTCTERGYMTHSCLKCGSSYNDSFTSALGHDYEDMVTEPTCEEDGYTTHTCTRCGHSYTDAHVGALGHDYILTGWDWAADFSKATAAFECRRDPDHTVYVTGVADTRTETAADGTVTAYHEVTVLFEEETYSNTQTETISVPKTGWQYESGEWYFYKSDGTLLTNGWAKDSTGWMWMGSDGKITKSKWIKDNGEWYYLKSNGYMAANEWTKDSSGWMYMDNSGKITKNKWIKDNGEWYYLKSNGYMAANEWTKDSSGWMYMDGSGKIVKNKWIKDNGEWYYLKSNGYMAANEWAKDSSGWMYMDGSGKITKSKWVQYKGDWYYLKADGYMATGTLTISGKEYTFASSGKLAA